MPTVKTVDISLEHGVADVATELPNQQDVDGAGVLKANSAGTTPPLPKRCRESNCGRTA
jgi:hypothetical protein